jgi:hypothetical protein
VHTRKAPKRRASRSDTKPKPEICTKELKQGVVDDGDDGGGGGGGADLLIFKNRLMQQQEENHSFKFLRMWVANSKVGSKEEEEQENKDWVVA